jgi:hypothetical protein
MHTASNEKYWIASCAAAQGVALLLLHQWCFWITDPARYFWLLWPLYTVAIWLPLNIQLLVEYRRTAQAWHIIIGFASVLAVMGAYKGWAAWTPGLSESNYWNGSAALSCLTVAALWFVLLPFAQLRLQRGNWNSDYAFLFASAWRNGLQLASALAFTGGLWLLLWLWAGLFAVLNVDFFAKLFSSRFFIYPTSTIAFGIGIYLYRGRNEMIHGIYCALLQIIGWLLPLAALVAVIFLAALPFTGLQPLWATRHAGALLLTLQGFLLLLFNASWQDGSSEPQMPRWLRRPLSWTMVVLPIYAALNAYALYLRVDQYGWSGERIWAALLITVCGFCGLGYAYAALRRSDKWMAGVAPVNTAAALFFAALLAATATPLLDPERIAVASQIDRLLSGKVTADTFDYRYLRFYTGRFGTKALQRLASIDGHHRAEEIRKKAAAVQKQKDRYRSSDHTDWTPEQVAEQFNIYPRGAGADPAFFRFLTARINAEPWSCSCLQNSAQPCLLLVLDLNGDGSIEHIVLQNAYAGDVYRSNGKEWSRAGELEVSPYSNVDNDTIKGDLEAGELRLLDPEWRDVEIGGRKFTVRRR